jgi:hypothetical protein
MLMKKYIYITLIALSFSFGFTASTHAIWAYSGATLQYTVTGAPECSDMVDNADPEDVLSDTNDPGCHSDGNASNSATYVASDTSETNAAGGPSGTLTAGSCTISTSGSSCSTSVAWTTADLTANPTTITRNTGSPASFTPSPLASGSQAITLGYGTTIFSLNHNSAVLAQSNGVASCTSGTTWNGSTCAVGGGPVNGSCSATHWSCIQGTSINQTTGSSQWTWTCQGSGGGTNDSCQESFPSYQCSDGIDNADPEDILVDMADPGCSSPSDNDETNVGSTQCSDNTDNDGDGKVDLQDIGCTTAADNDETNPKPIFIEF